MLYNTKGRYRMENKYLKLHSLLRMAAALIALITFISMFITKQVVHSEMPNDIFLMWNEAFFDDVDTKGTVLGFIGYLFVLFGGLAGLAFVFIDEFDAFYHFKLAFEVCKQLFNLDCQVFTSSHNTYLMTNDLLRPDCNFILQDNKIKPLQACTEKELRFGHNIEKLFRGGAFEI